MSLGWLGSSILVVGIGACSSPPSGTATPAGPAATAAASSHPVLATFEGSFDVGTGQLSLAFRTPSGDLMPESTLPYGQVAGDAYFHTCSVAAYGNAGAHLLTASVQGVNLTGSSLGAFTAVIDWTSPSSVTPASGIIADYSGNGQTSVNCTGSSNQLTWTFTDPTDTNFKFGGHAEGSTSPLFYENFSTLSGPTGGCGTQTEYHNANITNGKWTITGANALHGIVWETGNSAAMFWGGNGSVNKIALNTSSAVAANNSGQHYTVQFLGGPGNYGCGQGSNGSTDNLAFSIDSTGGSGHHIASYTYTPPAYGGGAVVLESNSFGYTGDGTGPVTISVTASVSNDLTGAIDDLGIYSP